MKLITFEKLSYCKNPLIWRESDQLSGKKILVLVAITKTKFEKPTAENLLLINVNQLCKRLSEVKVNDLVPGIKVVEDLSPYQAYFSTPLPPFKETIVIEQAELLLQNLNYRELTDSQIREINLSLEENKTDSAALPPNLPSVTKMVTSETSAITNTDRTSGLQKPLNQDLTYVPNNILIFYFEKLIHNPKVLWRISTQPGYLFVMGEKHRIEQLNDQILEVLVKNSINLQSPPELIMEADKKGQLKLECKLQLLISLFGKPQEFYTSKIVPPTPTQFQSDAPANPDLTRILVSVLATIAKSLTEPNRLTLLELLTDLNNVHNAEYEKFIRTFSREAAEACFQAAVCLRQFMRGNGGHILKSRNIEYNAQELVLMTRSAIKEEIKRLQEAAVKPPNPENQSQSADSRKRPFDSIAADSSSAFFKYPKPEQTTNPPQQPNTPLSQQKVLDTVQNDEHFANSGMGNNL